MEVLDSDEMRERLIRCVNTRMLYKVIHARVFNVKDFQKPFSFYYILLRFSLLRETRKEDESKNEYGME